jgi:argininosuccinate lyase
MKLWGGRFSEGLDEQANAFNASITFDWRLVEVDVRGSKAWAAALSKAGVISADEANTICAGLDQVLEEVRGDQFEFAPADEDVHTAVERRLTEIVGPTGGKLHTGRSRNDQVATDFRLWTLETIDRVASLLHAVQSALVDRATVDHGLVMPGYTHLQRAQPILLGHWWLSHFWPLQRDRERLAQLRERTAVLPLGSGALAGAPFHVDRQFLADELGFNAVSPNSLDAVSDRDFAAEFLFVSAMISVHLSRMSEMLILFSSAEFGFVELSDTYATGSSLMPQKKNPDTLELTRGKAGTVIGRLTGLLATLKSLPSAYDKDLQEDKPAVFETADTLELMLAVMAGLLASLQVRPQALARALDPALLATELADYLVDRGLPFRHAHGVVGQVVRRAQDLQVPLDRLPLAEFQAIQPLFGEDIHQVFDFQAAVARRNLTGGTGPQAVEVQLHHARKLLA